MRREGTILIVDDDPYDRDMIEGALKMAGARLRMKVLTGGAEAIAYLKGEGAYHDRDEHPYPTFMITDLKMVPVDGLEVLDYLRSTPRSAIIPTVVFSSSCDPDDVDKAYALGASSYHVKPATAADFVAQIRTLYQYWMTCEVPAVDHAGVRRLTDSRGRIGERFSSDPFVGSRPPMPAADSQRR